MLGTGIHHGRLRIIVAQDGKKWDAQRTSLTSRAPNGDEVPRHNGIPWQLLPLALSVHLPKNLLVNTWQP